ncbi:MAG: tryptophan--tRNA ligase [Patescibacteria group bacterium]|nr:tryptophan--tRNA ligase [Patescibacteria group bacterium]
MFNSKIQVYSGTRATGRLHLGNYLGMVKGAIELQNKYSCVYSVVDLHAITTPYDKDRLEENTLNVVLDYLAAGLNPEKSLIEVQSLVPQHMELAYYLGTLYPVSRLEDLPTYKEKKAQFPKYVNMGLLYYPVLMAADVLLYKASLVPVGVDQEPHLEVMREIARNFNRQYGETFVQPQRFATKGEYVPSLTGEGKMSKTREGSFINLTDSLEEIKNKLAKVPTDNGGPGKFPTSGPVHNLFKLVELFEGKGEAEEYKHRYQVSGIRYQDVKKELAEAIFKELEPIQDKRRELEKDTDSVKQMLSEHSKKLRAIAQETVEEVKEKMGFINI